MWLLSGTRRRSGSALEQAAARHWAAALRQRIGATP
jgi:hypothetical protein